jgi:hypothetical protein
VNVAKTGLWAEIQRERARQQHLRDQELRASRQAQDRAQREQAKAQKAAARKAAADLKESKRLYLEDRKAEAEEMSRALQDRVIELDGVLTAEIRTAPLVTFRSLKRQETYPPFDAGPLGEPLPLPQMEAVRSRPAQRIPQTGRLSQVRPGRAGGAGGIRRSPSAARRRGDEAGRAARRAAGSLPGRVC